MCNCKTCRERRYARIQRDRIRKIAQSALNTPTKIFDVKHGDIIVLSTVKPKSVRM